LEQSSPGRIEKMKILLTGAAGMLANDVSRVLIMKGDTVIKTDVNLREPDISLLDIRKIDDIFSLTEKIRPDIIFHLAAETNVDLCEQEPDHAFHVNTIGTENVALAARKHDIPLLYISTGAVFSGEKAEPYTEFDETGPLSVYGRSKLSGEHIVQDLLTSYFIIRAGWMIGGWELDKKFVFKIMAQLMEGKKEIKAVNDKFGSPTFTVDFADNIIPIVSTNRYGLYHMANKGVTSRYDIASEIVNILGLKDDVAVYPVSSTQFPLPAPRGRSEVMRNLKLDLLDMNRMPHWRESLEKYVLKAAELYRNAR
jgi:dTDP-4-dehydrorhamnose reductase